MIKQSLSDRYKVDPYGTEEILSDASVSLAPKLTIDYGDEVQEAEFIVRPTKGGVDPNIDSVANILSIKGNTSVIEESLVNCKMSGIKTTDGNSNLLCINPIPVTSLKGKLNGQGSSVVIFPDGMKSAGNVSDEIKVENGVLKAIKRIGSNNLGNHFYTKKSFGANSNYRFSTPVTNLKYETNRSSIANIVCTIYNTVSYNLSYGLTTGIASSYSSSDIIIYDPTKESLSDVEFKAAMADVVINFELDTPEEYVIDDVSIEKIMLGSTEVTKVCLGSDVIFQSQS